MKILTTNKKAYHNFFVSDFLEAGIELKGSEIKSVSQGTPYENSLPQSDTKRTRKLLLHKEEILKLERKIKEKGFSIIPTKVYIEKGKVKVEIALAKGKKLYDKRQVLKDKAIQRDIDRALKNQP